MPTGMLNLCISVSQVRHFFALTCANAHIAFPNFQLLKSVNHKGNAMHFVSVLNMIYRTLQDCDPNKRLACFFMLLFWCLLLSAVLYWELS